MSITLGVAYAELRNDEKGTAEGGNAALGETSTPGTGAAPVENCPVTERRTSGIPYEVCTYGGLFLSGGRYPPESLPKNLKFLQVYQMTKCLKKF